MLANPVRRAAIGLRDILLVIGSKQVKRIQWNPSAEGGGSKTIVHIKASDVGEDIHLSLDADGKVIGQIPDGGISFRDKPLEDVVGKGVAEKILGEPKGTLEGLDLKIGGEGLKRRYDAKHVDYYNKWLKPYGGFVQDVELAPRTGETVGEWRYEGPEMSSADLHNLQTRRETNSYDAMAIAKIRKAVNDGVPFAKAVEENGSISSAKLLGGELIDVPQSDVVRGIKVTPQMIEAFKDGVELLKTPLEEHAKELQTYADTPTFTDEQFADAQPKVKGSTVIVDPLSNELMRDVRGQLKGETMGLSMGYPLEPAEVKELIYEFRNTDGDAQGEAMNRVADALEKAAKVDGHVEWAVTEAVHHEGMHGADFRHATNPDGYTKPLDPQEGKPGRYDGAYKTTAAYTPFAKKFVPVLEHLMGSEKTPGARIAEGIAWFGDNQSKDYQSYLDYFGLTDAQAQHIVYLGMEGLVKENGVDGLKHFEKLAEGRHLYDIISELKERHNAPDLGAESTDNGDNGTSGTEVGGERGTEREAVQPSSESATTAEPAEEQAKIKPRRGAESMRLAGQSDQHSYYTVRAVDANRREAQDTIQKVGLQNAINQAIVPMVGTDESAILRHISLQMETADLLGNQERAAMAAGEKDLAEAYKAQKDAVARAYAEQGTDIGQAMRQMAELRLVNPETADLFINVRRIRKGLKPLTGEESKELNELAKDYHEAEQKVQELEAKDKTKPLTNNVL